VLVAIVSVEDAVPPGCRVTLAGFTVVNRPERELGKTAVVRFRPEANPLTLVTVMVTSCDEP